MKTLALAALEEQQGVLGYCAVAAPFSGAAVDAPAHAFESVEAGKPLATLLDDQSLRIEALAPSNWAAWLKPGLPLTFLVDETGESFAAEISHIDGRIDPGAQVITIFAEPRRKAPGGSPLNAGPLISGMTGAATFSSPPANPPALTQ